jgi:hypothetical protein
MKFFLFRRKNRREEKERSEKATRMQKDAMDELHRDVNKSKQDLQDFMKMLDKL